MARARLPELLDNTRLVNEGGHHVLLCGHTHKPFVYRAGDVTICNAGSAGIPLDGDPRVSWVAWERDQLTFRRGLHWREP